MAVTKSGRAGSPVTAGALLTVVVANVAFDQPDIEDEKRQDSLERECVQCQGPISRSKPSVA